jgi:hypothetical protein
MRTINENQMPHFLGATGEELLKLRLLLDPDSDGEYPQAEAARVLLAIRQRRPAAEPNRSEQPRPNLLQRLRRGVSRRVPPQ